MTEEAKKEEGKHDEPTVVEEAEQVASAPAATPEASKDEQVETTPTTDETPDEARIRGGGKSSIPPTGGRNNRRFTPYNNKPSSSSSETSKNCRVYVGNLAWDVSWQDLKDYVKDAGFDVTRADVMTGHDGRSKGCGIVEFATPEGAQKAVLTLNDTELNGRQIFVREDREERGGSSAPATVGSTGGGSNNRFASDDQAQSRRCYVGNLSWDVAWQDLKDHMREAGEVVHAEVISEANGRSKGCGIVEYATPDEARVAISTLTDTELKGRMIFVREDREYSNVATFHGPSGGASGGGGRRAGDTKGTSVYVWNLSYETSWQDLKDHMRAAGNIDNATILTGPDGRSIGCGIVVYQDPKEAARAIRELQNSELNNRPLYVREDRAQGRGGGGGRGGGAHGFGGGHGGAGRGQPREPRTESGTQLFVGNLSFDTSWQNLKDHFKQCGDVEHVKVMEFPGGRKKGVATVRMSSVAAAEDAVQKLNGVDLDGRNLEVRFDQRA